MTLKKQKKLISIITVSLNTKDDFKKTLDSLISQKIKKNIEIIVIDGASNDGTTELIKKNIKKIDKFLIKKDKGIYHAMNRGIKLAKGKWIIFMNAGDVFYDNNTLTSISKFCEKKNTAGIIFGDTIIDNPILTFRVKGNYFNKFSILMPFCHQSAVVKTNLLKKMPFDISLSLSSDFNFFKNCYVKNVKFSKLNKILSKVKTGGKSDIFRQKVLSQNIRIFWLKKEIIQIIMLFFLKITFLIKDFIKNLLPPQIIVYFLKKKHKQNSKKQLYNK